jgi:hypothetical protein
LGQDRAGYYSLENMTGADVQDGNTIRPERQPRAVGDPVSMAPAEILDVHPGEATAYRVVAIDPGHSLTLSQRSAPEVNNVTKACHPAWAGMLVPIAAPIRRRTSGRLTRICNA